MNADEMMRSANDLMDASMRQAAAAMDERSVVGVLSSITGAIAALMVSNAALVAELRSIKEQTK